MELGGGSGELQATATVQADIAAALGGECCLEIQACLVQLAEQPSTHVMGNVAGRMPG